MSTPRMLALILTGAPDESISCPKENGDKFHETLVDCGIVAAGNFVFVHGQAHREAVEIAVERAMEQASSAEFELLVYFSGHGKLMSPATPAEAPYAAMFGEQDYRWIHFFTLWERFPLSHVTFVHDCCHAGSLIELAKRQKLEERVTVLSSCSAAERSYELKERKLGAFTGALCQAILDAYEDPELENGSSVEHVFEKSKDGVTEARSDQKPDLHVPLDRKGRTFVPSRRQREREANRFEEFRKEISEEIREPRYGILLEANNVWLRYYKEKVSKATFRLSSGRIVKQFLTIWEVFDQREMLEKCISWLAEAALRMYGEKRYSCIVTCTDTARELGRYVRSEMRKKDVEMPLCHLGYPPSLKSLGEREQWLINSNCIVLTDVIATGTLLNTILKELGNGEGNVTGVLAFAVTNKAHIDYYKEHGKYKGDGKPLPLYYLAEVPIELLGERSAHPEYVIEIDHNSVLPRIDRPQPETIFEPLIPRPDMFKQMDEARAISSGFFLVDELPVFSYMDLGALIEHYGEKEIWDALLERFKPDFDAMWARKKNRESGADSSGGDPSAAPSSLVVVSSFKEGDIIFRDYFLKHLGEKLGIPDVPCLTVKRQTKDDQVIFESIGPYSAELEGKDLWVVFGTSSSTEKIRSVAGFLATHKPHSVRMIALLSRAGICSSAFLSKISKIGPPESDEATHFSFASVYSLREIEGEKARVAFSRLAQFFASYAEFTPIAVFRRMARELSNRYAVESTDQAKHLMHPVKQENNHQSTYTTLDAEIASAVDEYSRSGSFRGLEYFLKYNTKDRLFRVLTVVMLSDLSRLEISGSVDLALDILWNRIATSREERVKLEQNGPVTVGAEPSEEWQQMRNQVEDAVDLELSLIECFVLLKTFAIGAKPYPLSELVTGGKTPAEWRKLPLNYAFMFRNERTYFHFLLLRFSLGEGLGSDSASKPPTESGRILAFLEDLALHSQRGTKSGNLWMTSKEGLPPWLIDSAIDEVRGEESRGFAALAFRLWRHVVPDWESNWMSDHAKLRKWVGDKQADGTNFLESDDVWGLVCLSKAIKAQNRLFQTASYLRHLIQQSSDYSGPPRYALGIRQQGLLYDLAALDSILSETDSTGWIPTNKIRELEALYDRLHADFKPGHGKIREIVESFFSPLGKVLADVAAWLDERMKEDELATDLARSLKDSLESCDSSIFSLKVPVHEKTAAKFIRGSLLTFSRVAKEANSDPSHDVSIQFKHTGREFGMETAQVEIVVARPSGKDGRAYKQIVPGMAGTGLNRVRLGGGDLSVKVEAGGKAVMRFKFKGVLDPRTHPQQHS